MHPEKSKIDTPTQNIQADSLNQSDNIDEDMFMRLDWDGKEFLHTPNDINSNDCDQEVFVCEKDLGIGVDNENTLTQLRRQTLLNMISDSPVYNSQFFKSLCFCKDINRELFISPDNGNENNLKKTPKSTRKAFSKYKEEA